MGNNNASFKRNVGRTWSTKKDSSGPLQVSVVGASKVGKTSLISQLVFKKYPPQRKSTVAETFIYQLESGTGTWNVHFLDTSGVIHFPEMWRLYIATSDIFLVVYSFDKGNSLQEARDIIEEIKMKRTNGDVPIILVGNKWDLPCEEKELSFPVVDLLSIDWDISAHVLTSASYYEKTVGVLDEIVHRLVDNHRPVTRKAMSFRERPKRVAGRMESF